MCFHMEYMFECQYEPYNDLTAKEIWHEDALVCVMLDTKCSNVEFSGFNSFLSTYLYIHTMYLVG